MVWEAFSNFGTIGLYFLPPEITLNSSRYVASLKDKLKVNVNTVFMNDGAILHVSLLDNGETTFNTKQFAKTKPA